MTNSPRYAITPDEQRDAYRYLQRKLTLDRLWIDDPDAAVELDRQGRDALTLSQWCQRWLSPAQWQQLKAALRAARHRRRQYHRRRGPDLHLRLEREAAWVLTDLAKQEGLTRSAFILRHHKQAWLDLEEPETTLTTTPPCD